MAERRLSITQFRMVNYGMQVTWRGARELRTGDLVNREIAFRCRNQLRFVTRQSKAAPSVKIAES